MKLRTLFAGVVLSLLLVTAWAADPQIYFSRKDPVSQVIVREISAARKTIFVMMYSFTDAELADALIAASNRGVDVRIVFDRTQSSEKNSITTGLVEKLGSKKVVFRSGKGRGVMHEKMAITDGLTVMMGSYNWTNNAKNNNWENLIVLRDAKIASDCTQEFQRIWNSPAPGSGRTTKSETKKK